MRTISHIFIHCSATRASADIGAKEIRKWHVEDNGWSDIGYHEIIRRDGTVEHGRAHERAGAHAKGYNRNSIGICLIGGVDDNLQPQFNFTKDQMYKLVLMVDGLKHKYPNATVKGHNSVSDKSCPSFNVEEYFN